MSDETTARARLAVLDDERQKKEEGAAEAKAEADAAEEIRRREVFAAMEAEHGDVRRVNTVAGLVVIRAPKPGEYDRFHAQFHDEKQRAGAVKNLVKTTVVYPDRAEFDRMVTRKPGIVVIIGNAAVELAGIAGEELGKGS